jgi:tetratricopeptide (TPR) repeat protein
MSISFLSLLRAGLIAVVLPALAGAPAHAAASDKPGVSASAQAKPGDPEQGRRKVLDELFERLAKAEDAAEAKGVTGAIERVWMHSGSDTADLLMGRAMQALQGKDYALSQDLLGAIVEIEPHWAEAWNKRATVRYLAEDPMGAMQDIAHVLALEPRHFGALSGMGFILQSGGFDQRALQAFRKALEINPRHEDMRRLVDKLILEVEGQGI